MFADFVKYSTEHKKIDVILFEQMLDYIFSGMASENEIIEFLKITNIFPLEKAHYLSAVSMLRNKMHKVKAPAGSVDCCGTGGDSAKSGGSFNISTAVAFFAATSGLYVAKHGNRSISSKAGSADVLESLGYPIYEKPEQIEEILQRTRLCFMFAPYFHPALKLVGTARKSLKAKSFFNVLGPLLNPAEVKYQLLGIYDRKLAPLVVEILRELGSERVMIVQSSEGSDELTLSGDNYYCLLEKGNITEGIISGQEFGLSSYQSEDIRGDDAGYNAQAMVDLFQGNGNPAYRDTVYLNAGALHYISGQSSSLQEGIQEIQKIKEINFHNFL